jgi:secondary thiamine-phosphate synthase enzyme
MKYEGKKTYCDRSTYLGTTGDSMLWIQREIHLPRFGKGFHPITRHIVESLPELKSCRVGLLNIFIRHTSASLTINEAADPDVAADLHRVFDKVAPEDFPYSHTVEGSDDMPAHVKTTLSGCSLVVPIRNGQLALGTWQGIFLCEHRRQNAGRQLVLTLFGEQE